MTLDPWVKLSHASFTKNFDRTWERLNHLWPESKPKPRSIDDKIDATDWLLAMELYLHRKGVLKAVMSGARFSYGDATNGERAAESAS